MAHFANDLDFRRIFKNSEKYYMQKDEVKNIYAKKNLIVCDSNPYAFGYTVEFLNGTLLRYFEANEKECREICSLLLSRKEGIIYVPNLTDSGVDILKPLGFNEKVHVTTLYKDDYKTKIKKISYSFVNFTKEFQDDTEEIDTMSFLSSFRTSGEELHSLFKKEKILSRLCIIDGKCVAFSFFKVNDSLNYGYIIKMAVHKSFRRIGIGSMLLAETINTFIIRNAIPIFIDTIVDESKYFFKANGFKECASSYILIKK